MSEKFKPALPDLFISYSSRDRERVLEIVSYLEKNGFDVWIDRDKIPGGTVYGPEIVRAIKNCKVLILMCSNASMRSRNVKQEVQLAWKYERPYLPLLLEQISFPEQVQYWLEGVQCIEVLNLTQEKWLPRVLDTLYRVRNPLAQGLDGLWSVAKFTDQIWPLAYERLQRSQTTIRDLGAPQESAQHSYRLGARVCLAIESESAGYLTLLEKGTTGKIYCLCPSHFAPDTHLQRGRSYLPQENSRYESFVITGKTGQEKLLAIITDEELKLDWMPADAKTPSRVLVEADIEALLACLRNLEGDRWAALSTYFDIVE